MAMEAPVKDRHATKLVGFLDGTFVITKYIAILNGKATENVMWTKGWGSENASRMILFCFYLSQKASDLLVSTAHNTP